MISKAASLGSERNLGGILDIFEAGNLEEEQPLLYIYTCMYIYTYIYIYIYIHIYVKLTHIHVHIHIYIYIYMRVYMYTYINTYIYICVKRERERSREIASERERERERETSGVSWTALRFAISSKSSRFSFSRTPRDVSSFSSLRCSVACRHKTFEPF